MIPQAGSAYAYTYATMGELVAWIIGWDLILEYAVGNVAVAISWGDYFNTLLEGLRHRAAAVADDRLPHGAAQLRPGDPRPARHGAAHRRHPDPRPPAGVRDRDADHVAAAARRERKRRAPTTSWWSIKLLALGAVHRRRRDAHQLRTTTRRSRRTASPASIRARRSCSSPTSGSTRSRRRRKRRRTRSATCRSGFSAGWPSARSST